MFGTKVYNIFQQNITSNYLIRVMNMNDSNNISNVMQKSIHHKHEIWLQYLVACPLLPRTASNRVLLDDMRLLHTSAGIFPHSQVHTFSNSFRFDGLLSPTFTYCSFKRFKIRFKSGYWLGQSKILMP